MVERTSPVTVVDHSLRKARSAIDLLRRDHRPPVVPTPPFQFARKTAEAQSRRRQEFFPPVLMHLTRPVPLLPAPNALRSHRRDVRALARGPVTCRRSNETPAPAFITFRRIRHHACPQPALPCHPRHIRALAPRSSLFAVFGTMPAPSPRYAPIRGTSTRWHAPILVRHFSSRSAPCLPPTRVPSEAHPRAAGRSPSQTAASLFVAFRRSRHPSTHLSRREKRETNNFTMNLVSFPHRLRKGPSRASQAVNPC